MIFDLIAKQINMFSIQNKNNQQQRGILFIRFK